jgi:hypothetical protein
MQPLFAKCASAFVLLLAFAAVASPAAADQPLSVCRRFSGSLTSRDDGVTVLRLTGTAEALGRFSCYGELRFAPADEAGVRQGAGEIAFTAANGDLLVGVITADIDADGFFSAEIHWRDAVTFSDGTTVASSGHFAKHRPAGLIMKASADTQGGLVSSLKA